VERVGERLKSGEGYPRVSASPDVTSGDNLRGSARHGNAILVKPDDPRSLSAQAQEDAKAYNWTDRAVKIIDFIKK